MTISLEKKKEIYNSIVNYGIENSKKYINEKQYTPNKEANEFLVNTPLAFLFAAILDSGMKSEKVWEIPFILKQRLGYFDIYKIAEISDEEIIAIFNQSPKLHRFPSKAAIKIKKACKLIIDKYNGKTENIWNDNPRADDLQRRFEQFNGIGQKIASMATNILVREFGISVKDMNKSGIDISFDVHIRRVFLRSGLVDEDKREVVVNICRELNLTYPGEIDIGCWMLGKNICNPTNPKCEICPITNQCLKRIEFNPKGV